jgi:hypothetical protein
MSELLPYTMDAVEKILSGTISPKEARDLLQTHDRKGLTPIGFGVLEAAQNSNKLLSLLSLLEPPESTEKASLEQVVDLLTKVAENQARQDQMLTAALSKLASLETSATAQEQRLTMLETSMHNGFDSMVRGVKWLAGLCTGGAPNDRLRR